MRGRPPVPPGSFHPRGGGDTQRGLRPQPKPILAPRRQERQARIWRTDDRRRCTLEPLRSWRLCARHNSLSFPSLDGTDKHVLSWTCWDRLLAQQLLLPPGEVLLVGENERGYGTSSGGVRAQERQPVVGWCPPAPRAAPVTLIFCRPLRQLLG